MKHIVRWLAACAACGLLNAAEPLLVERTPKPNDAGYRPANGEVVRLNPPSFLWMHQTQAVTYTVQWARDPGFTNSAAQSGIPWNTYTHSAPLAPGTWHWRYRFAAKDGRQSAWSPTRSVVVPAEAEVFPMPGPAAQRERTPAGHPRLFMRPEDLPRLRELARGRESAAFDKLRQEAARIIAAGPTPEPTHAGSAREKDNAELVKYWWPNREQTVRACREAETLAFVGLISESPEIRQAARRWVLHLASWDPDGPTNFRMNCEAAKPMLYGPARAYDWAWDTLTPEERTRVQTVMARRVKDAWESGEVQKGVGHLSTPFNSHGNRVWHKIGEAGIAFLGEVPEAATWLDYAVNKFHSCYPVWSDDDGGWHEGVSYWAGYMSKAVWWLQVSRSALGVDGLRKPFFAHVGDYPLYIAPPNSPNSGFGDLSFGRPSAGAGAFMDYFIRTKGAQPDGARAGYWRWWTEQWNMKGESGWLGFLYKSGLPEAPPARPPADLPPSKVFQGIGVASLHTTLLDSRDDVHFLFKSSPFGRQSHGHNPHNSFQLNAYGEALLTTCVYRDLHGSKFHYTWAHGTAAHNAVLVDGEGQTPHSAAPDGRIIAHQFEPGWDYVAGDAAAAYGSKLKRYVRHAVLIKTDPARPVVVILDDLEAAQPAAFQVMIHALKPFEIDAAAGRVSVELPKAGVEARYLTSVPMTYRQWDGYTPAPKKEFPNQWHVEAATAGKHRALGQLTVLVPHRAGQGEKWTCDRLETPGAVGVRIGLGGRTVIAGFRKAAAPAGPAELAGIAFDGPVLVK